MIQYPRIPRKGVYEKKQKRLISSENRSDTCISLQVKFAFPFILIIVQHPRLMPFVEGFGQIPETTKGLGVNLGVAAKSMQKS